MTKHDISRFGPEVLVRWLEDKDVFGRTLEYILRSEGRKAAVRHARLCASRFVCSESQRLHFEEHLQRWLDLHDANGVNSLDSLTATTLAVAAWVMFTILGVLLAFVLDIRLTLGMVAGWCMGLAVSFAVFRVAAAALRK